MSLLKKLLLVLLLLLAAAGGWYFLYWQNTPAFAAGEIQQAVQKKDWDLFCKRVDVAKVYSYALDDMLSELKADGLPEHAIAASLVKSIKKEVVKELIRQTEIRFKDGAPASKSLLDKPVKTLTAYAGSSALSLTDIFKIEEADGKASQPPTSRVCALDEAARVQEIARMLGGDAASATSMAHASEMLASAAKPA